MTVSRRVVITYEADHDREAAAFEVDLRNVIDGVYYRNEGSPIPYNIESLSWTSEPVIPPAETLVPTGPATDSVAGSSTVVDDEPTVRPG